jgi:cytoplasmic iron level regulating protein YaaA (DUF328/UPF0246 family)
VRSERKGNWRVERLEGKKWVPYYRFDMPMRDAMAAGKRLASYYKKAVYRIRQVKNQNIIMCDIL